MRGQAVFLIVPLLLATTWAGCAQPNDDGRNTLVPYPAYGDIVSYDVAGSYLDFARWSNAQPFAAPGQVRFSVTDSPAVIDGARLAHPSYLVQVERAEAGGVFSLLGERYISRAHQSVVQACYPLTSDQNIVAFDERSLPWLFGASSLFGEDLASTEPLDMTIVNAHTGVTTRTNWLVDGDASAGGMTRVSMQVDAFAVSLWMDGSAWPVRVEASLSAVDPRTSPVGADGTVPASMVATRASMTAGGEAVPARARGAAFLDDVAATRAPYNGEHPPDGTPSPLLYPLAAAVTDAKRLDVDLTQWLAAATDPRIYRATYHDDVGQSDQTVGATWLLQWVDADGSYYEVLMIQESVPDLGIGVPRVASSGPVDAPANEDHGHFGATDIPDELVTLAQGVAIVRDVFGAQRIEIFLRSFAKPPGYLYFIDGGTDTAEGRYSVIIDPHRAFIRAATGPVTARLATG